MPIKDNIKRYRKLSNMTLEELATKVGVSRQTIQRYESGVISNIPSDKIEKMAMALNVTPAHIMGWEDSPEPTKFQLPEDATIAASLKDATKKLSKEELEEVLQFIEFQKMKRKK